MAENETDQLETDQVFIDTQAFVRERFDWQSKSCVRLKELVGSGQVQVLTTSITRSEVRSKIREGLGHARAALRRHDVVLRQLGNADALAGLEDQETEVKLQSLVDVFMDDVKAIDISLSKDVDKIFDDYFHERPPFSAKKKSEFPDAFVVASLQQRARATGKKIYVVSEDSDMRACCAHAPDLLISDGLADIISKATVTKTLHDSLLTFLKKSSDLEDKLADCLMASDIYLLGGARPPDLRFSLSSGVLQSVDEIEPVRLNVISQQGRKFLCELEFQASVEVSLDIGVERHYWDGEEDHEMFHEVSTSVQHAGYYFAEISVQFDDATPGSAVFDYVQCSADIDIDAGEIDELSRYR